MNVLLAAEVATMPVQSFSVAVAVEDIVTQLVVTSCGCCSCSAWEGVATSQESSVGCILFLSVQVASTVGCNCSCSLSPDTDASSTWDWDGGRTGGWLETMSALSGVAKTSTLVASSSVQLWVMLNDSGLWAFAVNVLDMSDSTMVEFKSVSFLSSNSWSQTLVGVVSFLDVIALVLSEWALGWVGVPSGCWYFKVWGPKTALVFSRWVAAIAADPVLASRSALKLLRSELVLQAVERDTCTNCYHNAYNYYKSQHMQM